MIDKEQLGKAIRQVRERRKWTQRQLAEKAGVTVTFVSMVETGQRGISLEMLNKFAEAIGVPTATLTCLASVPSSSDKPAVKLIHSLQQQILDYVADLD